MFIKKGENKIRPEKAYRIIRKDMRKWCDFYSYDETIEFKYHRDFVKSCKKLIQDYNRKVRMLNTETEYKWVEHKARNYNKSSFKNWRDEMCYISDRFSAPHRLEWMIKGIENEYFK